MATGEPRRWWRRALPLLGELSVWVAPFLGGGLAFVGAYRLGGNAAVYVLFGGLAMLGGILILVVRIMADMTFRSIKAHFETLLEGMQPPQVNVNLQLPPGVHVERPENGDKRH